MVLKISIYKVILRELVFIALAIFCNHKMFQRNQLLQNWFHPTEDEVLSEYRYAFLINLILKYVSKVHGQLCDSRKSYIASVTINPEGRQFHATDKICKKGQEIVYWCGH